MAAQVGSPVDGTGAGAASSIAAAAKSTTTGNAITVFVKWEAIGPTLSSVTDTAGNTYTVDQQRAHSGTGEPHGGVAYCLNHTGNASNVVTANFSAGTATFRQIIVQEWSGLGTAGIDGTSTQNEGTGVSFTTANITTTTTGLVVAGIGGFLTFGTKFANGTPTFTLGDTALSDTYDIYLISSSAQTVSPAASVSSGSDKWVMLATAFKDSSTALPNMPTSKSDFTRQPMLRGPM